MDFSALASGSFVPQTVRSSHFGCYACSEWPESGLRSQNFDRSVKVGSGPLLPVGGVKAKVAKVPHCRRRKAGAPLNLMIAAQEISVWTLRALEDEETGVQDVDRRLMMRDRETRAAKTLERSPRLTKQSQHTPRGAAGKQTSDAPRPWES